MHTNALGLGTLILMSRGSAALGAMLWQWALVCDGQGSCEGPPKAWSLRVQGHWASLQKGLTPVAASHDVSAGSRPVVTPAPRSGTRAPLKLSCAPALRFCAPRPYR